ncbi:hypothetical protein BJ165DRAFT_1347648 [Panaeolus papilionaceus]|nr:hypothetical protein BJ165DRAFT_1347648 [Panaeolus papilionaceus]
MSYLSELSDLSSVPSSDSDSEGPGCSCSSDTDCNCSCISGSDSDTSDSTVYIQWSSSPRQLTSTPVQNAVPLPDSESFDASSPVKGPSPLKAEKRRKKGARRRWANHRATKALITVPASDRNKRLQHAIEHLESEGLTVGDLTEYIFNPQSVAGNTLRWKHFFIKPGRGSQLLTWWVSPHACPSGRKEVEEFAISFVEEKVAGEATKMTREGTLRHEHVSKDSVTGFSFDKLFEQLQNTSAKIITRVILAITASKKQIKKGISVSRLRTKKIVVVSAIVSCLAEHSRQNNILKRIFALYLYACGTQRQVMSVLNHVGLSESYTGLTAKLPSNSGDSTSSKKNSTTQSDKSPATRAPIRKSAGSLLQLSQSMRQEARKVAARVTFGEVYDNINFADKVAEQVIGRITAIENGTCATIWPLHKAEKKDMTLTEYVKAFDQASILEISHIEHSLDEARQFKKYLIYCILRIIINHGGEGFQHFRPTLHEKAPKSSHQIEVHQTLLHPLPAMKIDESTIIGNAEVDEAIVNELGLMDKPEFHQHVRIIAGDQLSIARLRTLANLRAGHVGGYHSFAWGVWMPGLFHAKMADMHGFFVTHWGKPNTGTRNPGSLSYHNTLLRHLPISLTSLPNFRTCRDLVFVSLYARVLNCLLLVSKYTTLEKYCRHVADWDTLEKHATQIFEQYANPHVVDAHRLNRMKDQSRGDMVYENAILFLRDGLVSREFTDAIKAGDSGRVVLVLKTWAYSFRGNGRSKYAYEMLLLIHNITNVWPKNVVDIVLNNWLLNPSGKPNSFVEVDLVQEHMNYWIKYFYKAHGSNSSWDWLATISPCVDALRHLANTMKRVLGTDIGTRHAPPDLSRDIRVLMDSLKEHRVYEVEKGRKLDEDDTPVVDVVAEGLSSLLTGSALAEFNKAFVSMQERRRMSPVYGGDKINDNSPNENPLQQPSNDNNPSSSPGVSTNPSPLPPLGSETPNTPKSSRTWESGAEEPTEGDIGVLDDDEEDAYEGDESEEIEDEETLTLVSLDDVALEMDDVEVEDDGDLDEEYEGQSELVAEIMNFL